MTGCDRTLLPSAWNQARSQKTTQRQRAYSVVDSYLEHEVEGGVDAVGEQQLLLHLQVQTQLVLHRLHLSRLHITHHTSPYLLLVVKRTGRRVTCSTRAFTGAMRSCSSFTRSFSSSSSPIISGASADNYEHGYNHAQHQIRSAMRSTPSPMGATHQRHPLLLGHFADVSRQLLHTCAPNVLLHTPMKTRNIQLNIHHTCTRQVLDTTDKRQTAGLSKRGRQMNTSEAPRRMRAHGNAKGDDDKFLQTITFCDTPQSPDAVTQTQNAHIL
jgi:hypothetical protein